MSRRPLVASHRLVEHTGEVALRLEAPTWSDLLIEAARAMTELLAPARSSLRVGRSRTIEVEGIDREGLLVNWLNELVYLAEAEQWVPSEVAAVEVGDQRVVFRARGTTLPVVRGLVKAVTHHRVEVREVPGGWTADVVVDV